MTHTDNGQLLAVCNCRAHRKTVTATRDYCYYYYFCCCCTHIFGWGAHGHRCLQVHERCDEDFRRSRRRDQQWPPATVGTGTTTNYAHVRTSTFGVRVWRRAPPWREEHVESEAAAATTTITSARAHVRTQRAAQ